MAEGRFELRPVGPYSFGASVRFLEGFAPAAYGGDRSGHLHLAFVADGGEEVAVVCVMEEGGVILGEVSGGAEVGVVRRQVERILSLDVDGRGFPEVGERDPVVGELQARYPGLRPVCFYSPYEAAAWALIGRRRYSTLRKVSPWKPSSAANLSGPGKAYSMPPWTSTEGPNSLA